MKTNAIKFLACPNCRRSLETTRFEGTNKEIKSGVLACSSCKIIYPIYDYVPRLFLFSLPEYMNFKRKWKQKLKKIGYPLPSGNPEKGEEFIQRSFGVQWLEYEYGDFLWGYDMARLKEFILNQLGYKEKDFQNKKIVDIGCGNGVITNLFTKFGAEVIGLDLSPAAVKAANHFIANQRLHFVQASLFHPPFKKGMFDVVYSTGVLHHTYSTKNAFFSIANLCKHGGRTYVWLYGDYKGFAKFFNIVTNSIRFVVSRLPSDIQNSVVELLAFFYGFAHTKLRKYFLKTPTIKYNRNQLIHAVRDRFTPVYAHMHNSSEVMKWFSANGFYNITSVKGEGVSVRGNKK